MAVRQRYIRSLDTLRGLGCLCVAAAHARWLFRAPGLLPHAYLLVDLFFILSGLVVYRSYSGRLADRRGALDFFAGRFARLAPLYVVATGASAAILVAQLHAQGVSPGLGRELRVFLMNAVGLPDLWGPPVRADGAAFPFLVPAWSVAWEAVVSVLFAGWMLTGRRALLPITALLLLLLFACTVGAGNLDFGWRREGFAIGGLRALAGFAVGVCCARALERGWAPRGGWAWLGLSSLGLVAIYIAAVRADLFWAEAASLVLAFPLVVLSLCGLQTRLLENRAFDALGGASYAGYMLHPAFIQTVHAAEHALRLGGPGVDTAGYLLLLGPFTVACWWVWTRFELPAQARILSAWREAKAARAAGAGRAAALWGGLAA